MSVSSRRETVKRERLIRYEDLQRSWETEHLESLANGVLTLRDVNIFPLLDGKRLLYRALQFDSTRLFRLELREFLLLPKNREITPEDYRFHDGREQ